jgi:hypothetical protein
LKPEANVDVTGTITATGTSVFTNLDISGDIDVDGTTNLDVVDIDGSVDMASTLKVGTRLGVGVAAHASAALNITTTNQHIRFNNGSELAVIDLDSDGELNIWSHGDGEVINLKTGSGSPTTILKVDNTGIDVTGTIVASSSVTGQSLVATNGIIQLDDNGSHNGIMNVPASLYLNIDSDAGATGEGFIIAKDRTATSGGTELFRVQEDGNVGIGASSLSAKMHVKGAGTSSSTNAIFAENSSGAGVFAIRDNGDAFILGNVGIGTSSIDNKVNIQESALSGRGASNGNTSLTLEHATDTGIQFFSATQTQLRFGDAGSTGAGSIIYEHGTDKLRLNTGAITSFEIGGSEKARIDSSGNLLVGKTVTTFGTAGIALRGTVADFTRDGGTPINVNRLTSDGSLIDFHKAGTVVGSIGTLSGTMYIGNGDCNLLLTGATDQMLPVGTNGATKSGQIDLGSAGNLFKDLYLSGGVVFGATGGAVTSKTLDDYEEGTWTPTVSFGGASVSVVYTANTNGRYVKVGGVVHVSGCLFLSSKGSSTGDAAIGGLPFNMLNSAEGTKASAAIGQLSGVSFTAYPSMLASGAALYLYDTTTGGTLATIDDSNLTDGTSIYFTASYAAA